MFNSLRKHTGMWKTLFKHIHVSAAPKRFWTLHIISGMLYAGTTFPCVETYADKMKKSRNIKDLAKHLNGGAFVRTLSFMVRHADGDRLTEDYVLKRLSDEAPKANAKVIIQALAALKHDLNNMTGKKAYFPVNGRVFVKDNVNPLPTNVFTLATISTLELQLQYRFEKKDFLGHVYVDEQTVNGLTIPLAERLAVQGTKNVARFSRIPFGEKDLNTIRLFLHWKDGDYRTDLDLSVAFFSADGTYSNNVSYTTMKNSYSVHGGDLTSAPTGASEFVDIDTEAALKAGVRYAMTCCFAYSGQNLKDVPEASSGWMMRQETQKGEIFDARTVENRFSLNKNGYSMVSVIFDLQTREAIWMDTPIAKSGYGSNVERTNDQLEQILFAGVHHNRPTMKLLIDAHIKSRGIKTYDRGASDTIIDGTTKSALDLQDFDTVLAEYVN